MADITWAPTIGAFRKDFREPKRPAKPSDTAISLAQRSYDGQEVDGETVHVMTHRFSSGEQAALAVDELKRAGYYTTPASTVRAEASADDPRMVTWIAGPKRGRRLS